MLLGFKIQSILIVIPILILYIFVILLIIILIIQTLKKRKYILCTGIVLSIIISLLLVSIFVYSIIPGGDKILDRIKTSDGTELCILQKSNYLLLEPYTVNFYYKRPNDRWYGLYYDHQDTRWYKGTIELNEERKLAIIKRGSSLVAIFNLNNNSLTIKKLNRTENIGTKMPENWKPEDKIKK
jgi:energy-coupling factor transporter transmembrane protein EcfT